MTPNTFAKLSLAGAACLALGLSARAGGSGEAGSLLVFTNFDNSRDDLTLITVTNTSDDQVNGSVNVEFVYINGENCQEFNRTRTLTPNDEVSVLTANDNPNEHKGYVYVFAKSKTTGAAIKFDHLIGSELVLEGGGDEPDFLLAPWVFKAGAALAEGANTDLNGNGLRDLDGNEYQEAPDTLLVPRFIGHGGPQSADEDLVLINLTGGADFTAVVDFLVYNDNEEVFSAQYSFQCWAKVDLIDISAVFENDFLVTTNVAHPGTFPYNANQNQTGWFRINGDTAFSTAAQFSDPAILASQVESLHTNLGGGMLPFTAGLQSNGSLLSHNLLGN
jgi:hypothetical protein